MTIIDSYAKEKQRYLDSCIQCGVCAEECPILPYTGLSEISCQDIQEGVFDFLSSGVANQMAYTKAFACMECFKCTVETCPEGLNPMLINEIIKGEYLSRGLETSAFGEIGGLDGDHRVLASIQVSRIDYKRIFSFSQIRDARYVFFPGCNIYLQPEKLLNALDIIDAIGDDFAFVPGLDYCCGDNNLFCGDIQKGSSKAEELLKVMAGFCPERVILWCPTCLCRINEYASFSMDIPFDVMSFPQYLSANMDKLQLTDAAAGTATLHEACKCAYTRLDLEGPREVLRQLPGVRLKEMKRRLSDTACCGSGAISWFPDSFSRICDGRLEEAARTGAERLVTVCHYCNQAFAEKEEFYDFRVVNYVSLVAEAIGVKRDDKFRLYTLWKDIPKILKDSGKNISESPFEKKRIIESLQSVFGRR